MKRAALVMALSIPIAGCIRPPVASPPSPDAVGVKWVAHLAAMMATGTRIFGEVHITPSVKPNYSHITIEIAGGAISNRHPWVITSGNCGEIVPIDLGGRAMYPPLELRTDGAVKLTVDLPITVPVDAHYHVAVFASSADRDLIVSCGELAPVT